MTTGNLFDLRPQGSAWCSTIRRGCWALYNASFLDLSAGGQVRHAAAGHPLPAAILMTHPNSS